MSCRKLVITAATFSFAGVGASWADDVQFEALKFAEQQNYDAALAILEVAEVQDQETLPRDLLKARLLSWAGRYSEAHELLCKLKSTYPDTPDIDVTFGNLFYYQGKLDPAGQHFANALQIDPAHGDAIAGQERVSKAKEARRIANLKWRVDAGGSYSSFEDDAGEDWNEQYINVQRNTGDVAISVGANRYQRFGKTDTEVKIGVDDAKSGGLDWGAQVAVTPDADFRPKASVGGRVGGAIEVTDDIKAYLSLGYKYDQFEDNYVQSAQPELTTYFSNGLELTGKVIVTDQQNEELQTGYLVQGVYPIAETVRLKLGYADAPEVINGQAVNTKTYFGGVSFDINDTLTLHANAARQDRADNITRDDFSVGFTRKF